MHPATSGTPNDETGAMPRFFHYLLFYYSKDSPSGQINLNEKPGSRNTGIGAMRLARKTNAKNTAWCRRKGGNGAIGSAANAAFAGRSAPMRLA